MDDNRKNNDEVKKIKLIPLGVAWDTIKAMLPDTVKLPENLDPEQLAIGKELQVRLELSWKGTRADDSSGMLDQISTQLRNVDSEVDWSITTKSGAVLSKDDVKLKRSVSVQVSENGLLIRRELWPKMEQWLVELIQSNSVVSDV